MLSLEKIQKRAGRSYFVKVLIQDDNKLWVDFSDRVKRHKDRIIGIPKIKINTDSRTLSHRFYASSGSMTVDNSDGFWDSPIQFTFTTETGATASFSNSKAASETVWSGRKVQFRLFEQFNDTFREKALGTFLIDDIETSLGDDATISIVDLSEPLRSRDASVVKNGMSWYQNRSISFLVNKLLELEYGLETNGLVSRNFDIDARIDLETFDGTSTISTIGPPPQLTDTDGDGIADIYIEKQMRTRAMVIAPATIGLANIGDPKDTLYLASDNYLYSYSPTRDVFTKLATVAYGGDNYYIRFMWYDATRGIIFGYASIENTDFSGVDVLDGLYELLQGTSGHGELFFKYTTTNGLSTIYQSYQTYNTETASKQLCYHGLFVGRISKFTSDVTKQYIGQQYNGSNIYTPYRQFTFILPYSAAAWWEGVSLQYADSAILVASTTFNTPTYFNGYTAFMSDTAGTFPTVKYGIRYTVGSKGNICFNQISSSSYLSGCILKFGIGSSDVLNWRLFSPQDNGFHTIDSTGNTLTISGTACMCQPISACADGSSAKFYIGIVAFLDKKDANYDDYDSQIWKIDYSTSTPSKSVLLTTAKPWIPVELFYNSFDSTYKLWVVYMCQDRLLSNGTSKAVYKVAKINTSTGAQLDVTNLSNLSNQPTGFTFDASGNLYFVTHQAGLLYKYSGTTLTLLDSGFPITEESPFLSAGLCADTATRSGSTILWGVSAGEIDNLSIENPTQAGKCYLFKYDKVISETVELADFSDMSVWDALGYLAQRGNCSMGFDEEGNFFFKKRAIDSAVSYTINADDNDVFSVVKDRGKDDIFNYVEVTPYIVTYKQPEYKGYLNTSGRSGAEDSNTVGDDEIVLKQTDLITKKIEMICIVDGDMAGTAPIFKYVVYEPVITGRFVSDQTSATVLNVGSTFGGSDTDYGIKPNYYLLYTDSSENEYYRRITAVNTETNTITVDTAITVAKNDEFSVYRRYKTATSDSVSKVWSDEGVTFITTGATNTVQTVNSLENLSVGLLISINDIYARVLAIDEDNSQITLDKTLTSSTGSIVKAFFSPAAANTWYEIGNNNVQIMIATQAAQTIFKQGDRITIDCPGLVTEADEASRQIALNNQSIAKYGKNQYPNINNRFLTRKLSKQLAQKIRTLYAWPKYGFKVTMPLSNYLDVVGTANLARIDLRSQKLLPYRDGFTEQCRIVSIEHDCSKNMTTLELKSDTAY